MAMNWNMLSESMTVLFFSEVATKRLKMLSLNHVDIVIDDDVVLCSEIQRQGHNNLTLHPLLLSQADIHFIFIKTRV